MTELVGCGTLSQVTYVDPYDWEEWHEDFAWLPTTMENGERIWMRSYFWRCGEHRLATMGGRAIYTTQKCHTLFDILQQ